MFYATPHPSLSHPHAEATLWRYMDMPRLLSILENRSLAFARIDQMSDKWEGSLSPLNVEMRSFYQRERFDPHDNRPGEIRRIVREGHHVNCWHEGPVESAAMWDIYQRDGSGVAIQTTWGALTASLRPDRHVYGSRVSYVDYSKTYISEMNVFDAIVTKRESFAHEREVRLFLSDGRPFREELPVSIPIPVDVDALIQKLFVAPDSPVWFLDLVAKVVQRFGYHFKVTRSDLASSPFF